VYRFVYILFVFICLFACGHPCFAMDLCELDDEKPVSTALARSPTELYQIGSPFIVLPKQVRVSVFSHTDQATVLNLMLSCKLFRRELLEACTYIPTAWASREKPQRFWNPLFHPRAVLTLFELVSLEARPLFRVKPKVLPPVTELVEDFTHLVRGSRDASWILCEYLLHLDPGHHYKQVWLGAHLTQRIPEFSVFMKVRRGVAPLSEEEPVDVSFDPKLKARLMATKLSALAGDEEANEMLNEDKKRFWGYYYFHERRGIYFSDYGGDYRYSLSMLPPLWPCYFDKLSILLSHLHIMRRYPLDHSLANNVAFCKYFKAFFQSFPFADKVEWIEPKNTFLRGLTGIRPCFEECGLDQDLEEIDREIIRLLDFATMEMMLDFSKRLLARYSFHPSELYSKVIEVLEGHLRSPKTDSNYLDNIALEIVKSILTYGYEHQFEAAAKYVDVLLGRFGENVKCHVFDGELPVFHINEVLDLKAILALHSGNFEEANTALRTGTSRDADRYDLRFQYRDTPKLFISIQRPSLLREFNRHCTYSLALLRALKKQMNNPDLPRTLIKKGGTIVKFTYNWALKQLSTRWADWAAMRQISQVIDADFVRIFLKWNPVIKGQFLEMLSVVGQKPEVVEVDQGKCKEEEGEYEYL